MFKKNVFFVVELFVSTSIFIQSPYNIEKAYEKPDLPYKKIAVTREAIGTNIFLYFPIFCTISRWNYTYSVFYNLINIFMVVFE